jgi:hypothetical protein
MVINRSHIPWFIFSVIVTVLIAIGYAARFHPEWLPFAVTLPAWLRDATPYRNTVGGTRIGLLYGTAAFVIFIFAVLLGARKKKPLWRLGRVEFWLRAHIWLTLLTIPLVGFHCGWHWGSPHTTWALLLYIAVMASGIFGLAMQQFLPGFMKERLPREVVFEQIPNIRRRAIESAEQLMKDSAPPAADAKPDPKAVPPTPDDLKSAEAIRDFLDDGALDYLRAKKGRGHLLDNPRESDAAFRQLKLSVTPKWLPRVEELQGAVDERRRTDLQTNLQHWLHGWLLIHVPVSMLLIVVTLWHAIVAVRLFIVQP